MIWIVIGFAVIGTLMYLVVIGATKREEDEGEELERWFLERLEEDGYEALYEEIRAEDVPEGFEDLLK